MSEVKDIANIIFFVTMSLVAVLSYLQARRTIFSPIRTEVFKLQIDSFKDVISFFNRQGQSSFDKLFDFHGLFEFNAERMQRTYINTFFHAEIELKGNICESLEKPPCLMIVNEEDLSDIAEKQPDSCCHLIEETENIPNIKDPALKLAFWNEYKLRGVHYSASCSEKMEEMRLLASSPVLPTKITDLIYEFIDNVHFNISLIKDVIEDCASELTERYPTADDVLEFKIDWMWNRYNEKRKNLELISDSILLEVNEYLQSNNLMK